MSSSSRIAGLLIAVATLLAADYALAAPLLRILYNAETRGALYPCPS